MSQEVMVTLALFGLGNLVAVMIAWMNLNVRVKALEVKLEQHDRDFLEQREQNDYARRRMHEIGNDTQKILGMLDNRRGAK